MLGNFPSLGNFPRVRGRLNSSLFVRRSTWLQIALYLLEMQATFSESNVKLNVNQLFGDAHSYN